VESQRGALVDKYISDEYCGDKETNIVTLGNVGTFVRGLTYSASDVTEDMEMIGVIRSNNLELGCPVDTTSNLVFVKKRPMLEQRLVNGDIVICMANGSSSLVGKASPYQSMRNNLTVGAFCGIYRGHHPLTRWIFISSAYSKAISNAIQGGNGAIANLHGEDILSMRFSIPADQEIVSKICGLLCGLDIKILDAKRLLHQYRQQKQFLLRNMFI